MSVMPTPVNEPVRSFEPNSLDKKLVKAEVKALRESPIDIPLVIGKDEIHTVNREAVHCPHEKANLLARVSVAGKKEAQAAIDTAIKAQKSWSTLSWQDRAAVFLKAADLLSTKYRPKMNAATMLGQSKTIYQAEIDAACELIDFFRFNVSFVEKIYEQQPHSPFGQRNEIYPRGLEGFVYAIGPFNFTSISINLACAPALMGCATIWKPAHTAVFSSYVGMKLLEEAGLPPGVITFLPGNSQEISNILLNDSHLAGIHFTGSTGTFNHLWKNVGENISKYKSYPRLVGETGGKDFIFAHASADPDQLIAAIIRGAFEYQGQKCSAASRAYIPKKLWEQIKPKLISLTDEIKMGDPEDFTNFMSAVIDAKSFQKIKTYIDHARAASDAKIIAGGTCDDSKGYFIRPTVIETSNPNYKSMVEEIFGPVFTIFPYDEKDFENTLDLCDKSTPYALTGAIFARERNMIRHMTNRLENAAGNFYINDKPTGAVVNQQPFGGSRQSGTNDKAGSIYNLVRWASFRTVKENFLDIRDYRYPFMQEP